MPNAVQLGSATQRNYALDWPAVLGASLVAGLAFMMIEMALVALTGGGFWGPPRMIAAMVLGAEVLPPPASFDLTVMLAAIAIHMPLSFIYGLVLGWMLSHVGGSLGRAALTGSLLGLALYVVNFHLIAPAAFPWFVSSQGWVSIISHAMFGLILGWAYHWLSFKRAPL